MSKSNRLSKGKPSTTIRTYKAYYNETDYEFIIANSLDQAKEKLKERFPDKKFIKIKMK